VSKKERVIKRTLADGTVREYRYGATDNRPTIGRLIAEYKASSDFGRLADSTKRAYRLYTDMIGEDFHASPIEEIRRRHIKGQQDVYQRTPGKANSLVQMWSTLLSYAVEIEYVPYNVAWRIKMLPMGEHARWPEEVIEYSLNHLAERVKRAVILALYTGQREGDVVSMRWSDIEDGGIHVVQEKTRTKLWISAHRDLLGYLAEWRRDTSTLTILSNTLGTPWASANAFAGVWRREKANHPMLDGFVFHGLRKSAAARLAESGCSAHEIMSITGHASLKEVERYTREVSQKRNSKAAIIKLESYKK
jgi:integrase